MSTSDFSDLKIKVLKISNRNMGGAGSQHGAVIEVIPRELLLGYSPGADRGFVEPEAYTILGPSLMKKYKITRKNI
jgi:hypothetical protein